MPWEIQYAGIYTKPQRDFTQITVCPWAGLHVSGITLWELPEHGVRLENPPPFIFLLPPTTKIHFRSKAPRENWVVFLNRGAVEGARCKGFAKLNCPGGSVETPLSMELDPATAAAMQLEFLRMKDGAKSPLPALRILGNLALSKVLAHVIEGSARLESASPASELKRLIDMDVMRQDGLDGLAKRCGYTLDHLRKLFIRKYGMKPNVYRERRRMAEAMELVAKSKLSVKEISDRMGFAYMSHFSASFKSAYGFSPSEGIRRFRISSAAEIR